jgi:hypothetical protein
LGRGKNRAKNDQNGIRETYTLRKMKCIKYTLEVYIYGNRRKNGKKGIVRKSLKNIEI